MLTKTASIAFFTEFLIFTMCTICATLTVSALIAHFTMNTNLGTTTITTCRSVMTVFTDSIPATWFTGIFLDAVDTERGPTALRAVGLPFIVFAEP